MSVDLSASIQIEGTTSDGIKHHAAIGSYRKSPQTSFDTAVRVG